MGKLETKFTKVVENVKYFRELKTGDYFQFSIGSHELYMKTDHERGYVRVSGLDYIGKTYVINNVTTRVYDVDIVMEVTVVR